MRTIHLRINFLVIRDDYKKPEQSKMMFFAKIINKFFYCGKEFHFKCDKFLDLLLHYDKCF